MLHRRAARGNYPRRISKHAWTHVCMFRWLHLLSCRALVALQDSFMITATLHQAYLQKVTHPLEGHDEREVHICRGTATCC